MALHEHSVDPRFGRVVNHDFAEYHIAANADVGSVEVHWLDEEDPYVNPMGSKGIGGLGIVGTAAAIANAVFHATGIRAAAASLRALVGAVVQHRPCPIAGPPASSGAPVVEAGQRGYRGR